MIFNKDFTLKNFKKSVEYFSKKLKSFSVDAFPADYKNNFRGADNGVDSLIESINNISTKSLDQIKKFLQQSETILINECRGEKTDSYKKQLDYLIPNLTKIRPNDYYHRLHHLRLFLSYLALEKIIRLNCLAGSHPKSTKAAERISTTKLNNFLPALAVDFWLGATLNRYTDNENHVKTNLFQDNYFNYIGSNSVKGDKLNQAFKRLADIIVANGITEPKDITLEVLLAYHEDLVVYYKGSPPSYSIKPAINLLSYSTDINFEKIYQEFLKNRTPSKRKGQKKLKNEQIFKGNTKIAKEFIGDNVDNVNEIRVPITNKKVTLDYGYWSDISGTDSTFVAKELDSSNIWIAAQIDFLRYTSIEHGTIKQKNARLSILNKYIFSYLPAYFKSGLSGKFEYPKHPTEFLPSLFIQRSNIFEIENANKFTENFQYPVPLQQFVYDMTSAAKKENTTNNNSGRDALVVISNFFDYLSSLDSPLIKGFRNPLTGMAKKKIGKKYAKNRKYIFSLEYWLGLRSFCKTVTNHMLNEVTEAIRSGENNTDYIIINEDIFMKDSAGLQVGRVSLKEINQLKVLKHSSNRGHKGVKDFNIYLHNYQAWAMITLLLHSGLRRSNAMWIDDTECFSLSNETSEYQELLISTDKTKTEKFSIIISAEIMKLLKEVANVKSLIIESNPELGEKIPYQGNPNSKWGDISPLFRTKLKHNDNSFQHFFSEIINEYESFLIRNNIDYIPTTLFAPKLGYALDEFIYLSNQRHFNTEQCEISVDYIDDYSEVKFIPLHKRTLITPHSLRTMTDSVFAPIVGADVVGKLLTGQSEATVSYYTKKLPDSASQDFINEVINLIELTKDTDRKSIITVAETEINEKAFESDLEFSPGDTINKYNAKSLNFNTSEDFDYQLNGLRELKKANPNNIKYFRTHICPVGGSCPKTVCDNIGKRNCYACPLAIVTNNHFPAIKSHIKFLCDEIGTINTQLEYFIFLETEKDELNDKKSTLLTQASYWAVRLTIGESSNGSDIYYVSDEGLKIMNSFTPYNDSEQARLLLRLKETEGIPLLHSDKLKIQASRFRRKIEFLATQHGEEITELNDLDYLAQLFNIKTDLYGLSVEQKLSLIKSPGEGSK
ncbi:hypothetical protein [Celerinatantimonas sp. MCCC 1A17872]|uniref:hypothetical protein n=1 Tax=Celerinatantimonas sp. MCCC 1A17872 TaxID=3177514 RepID=UPI0038C804EF